MFLFFLVINQLDAQNFCFTISLFHASTCFEHHLLIIMRSKLYWPPVDEHMCSKHVEAWNETYCKTKILCIKLVNYQDKYTEMQHGQRNVKTCFCLLCNFDWKGVLISTAALSEAINTRFGLNLLNAWGWEIVRADGTYRAVWRTWDACITSVYMVKLTKATHEFLQNLLFWYA